MNNDVEDLLREGMERFTRDLQAPAGLIRDVVRRRRRRLARRTATGGASALAAGAVALAVAVLPGARHSGDARQVRYTAYVVKHVDGALSAAEPGEIAQMTVTRSAAVPGGKTATTTAEEWSYGDEWRSVTMSQNGHPAYDEGLSASFVYTLVNYVSRTWARQRGLGRPAAPLIGSRNPGPLPPTVALPGVHKPGLVPRAAPTLVPRGCAPVVAGLPLMFAPWLPGAGFPASPLPAARALGDAISCGTLIVAGRQRVDGIEALKLTSRRNSPISETIWVTPGTDLPVRVVVRSLPGGPLVRQTADITWLQPTAQNLAKLIVPIPAGFRHVPLIRAVTPILQHGPDMLLPDPASLCLPLAGAGLHGPAQCIQLGPTSAP